MSIYRKWGYISNPFKPNPLNADEQGANLLVGRDNQKRKIINRILSNSGITTVEGENGIGKTSLINVCLFEIFNRCKDGSLEELYIPCTSHFQLTRDCDIREFSDGIIYTVAQTLLKYSNDIKRIKKTNAEIKHIDTWLNTPETQSISAQILSVGAGESREINTSEGYLKSGFRKQLINWLNTLFPSAENGGVICMIDNLELLKTSQKAKETMEVLRDELFTINGIKWIFSGSHGVINSIASSTRMSGYLLDPVNVPALSSAYLSSLLNSRIKSYQSHIDTKPYNPITEEDFNILFKALNGNLRESLLKLSSFSLHIADLKDDPHFNQDKTKEFKKWFLKDQESVFDSLNRSCSKKDFQLLKMIKYNREEFTAEQIKSIGFSSIGEVLESVNQLEQHGLITIPLYEQLDIKQLNEDYGSYNTTDDVANSLFDDYLFKVFYNVQISPKGYYIEEKYK